MKDKTNIIHFPDLYDNLNRFRLYSALMELHGEDELHALYQITEALMDYFASIDDPMAEPCRLKALELRALIEEMFEYLD